MTGGLELLPSWLVLVLAETAASSYKKESHSAHPTVNSDFCLFDLSLYVPSTMFQLNRDGSSWVEPVLS